MRTLTPRRLHGLAALAAVAGTVALTAPAGAQASTPRACQTGQLVTFLGNGEGAAGSVDFTLHFDNLGATCTLRGYPGVSAVNRKGKQLGKSAAHGGGTVRTVTIKAAKGVDSVSGATAMLQVTDVQAFPSARCKPTLAAGLRVYPPNQKASQAVPLPFGACTTSGTNFLSVRAVK